MTGLNWTYETLCEVIPNFTRHSSSPTSSADLNPIIKQLLAVSPGSSIYGVGGHSVLLSITEDIAAKVSLKPGGVHVRYEQNIFTLLDQTSCSGIVRAYLCRPDVTFLQLFRNGTLHQRMTMVNKPRPILLWMQQLSDGVACLESLGLAHGDINPRNILLDDQDQLKLIDFDHARQIGDDLEVGYEPYVRFHRPGATSGGPYGVAGPTTEQFALGSVFWYITRGTELYADLEGSEQVDRLMDCQFPATDPQDPIDDIISNCWIGTFRSIADLSQQIRKVATFNETYRVRKKICERYDQLLTSPNYR